MLILCERNNACLCFALYGLKITDSQLLISARHHHHLYPPFTPFIVRPGSSFIVYFMTLQRLTALKYRGMYPYILIICMEIMNLN